MSLDRNNEIELSFLDIDGFNIAYDSYRDELIINGWTGYGIPLHEQRINLKTLLLCLSVPFSRLKSLYPEKSFVVVRRSKKKPVRKNKKSIKKKPVYKYKWKFNKEFIAKYKALQEANKKK